MKRTVFAIAAATATFASAIGLVSTGGWLISMAALRPPLLTLEVAIVSVRAFGIARGSFRWVERVISHDAALHETVERRAALWTALAKAGPRGAWGLRRGDAVTRLMQDAEVMQDRLTRVVVPATAALITAAGAVALQSRLHAGAGLAFLAAILLAGVVVPLLTHRIESLAAHRALEVRASMNAALSEFVSHRDEMRVLGVVEDTIAAVAQADERRIAVETRAARMAGFTQFLALLASGIAILVALVSGVPAVLDGSLDGPDLAVVALLPWSASEVVTALAAAASSLVRVRAAQQRLLAVEDLGSDVPMLVAGDERLRVRDLSVVWDTEPVVRGVSFDAAVGQRVAIVGASGAGKSSVVSALLGLVPYGGSVSIGEAAQERAARITAVPQHPHVFRTTMRENLRMAAGDVEDARLEEALQAVGLAHVALERDLSAAPLSGGEAQRLGLARALLVDAPVLVLDEPTEHLDDESAARVMEAIRSATRDRAVVMTTHRLTDLRDADHVLVLEGGVVACAGTWEQCMAGSAWFRDAVQWHLDKSSTR